MIAIAAAKPQMVRTFPEHFDILTSPRAFLHTDNSPLLRMAGNDLLLIGNAAELDRNAGQRSRPVELRMDALAAERGELPAAQSSVSTKRDRRSAAILVVATSPCNSPSSADLQGYPTAAWPGPRFAPAHSVAGIALGVKPLQRSSGTAATQRIDVEGRVEMWRGFVRSDISVSAPFFWRCLRLVSVAKCTICLWNWHF
jgi:hypothetical protein